MANNSNLTVPSVPGEIPRYLEALFPLGNLMNDGVQETDVHVYRGIYKVIDHLKSVAARQEKQEG